MISALQVIHALQTRLRSAVSVVWHLSLVAVMLPALTGCASLVARASADMAENLTAAIVNQDDPELVRTALPSYLLLLDSFAASNPDNPATLSAAARLYAAYGAALVDDPQRSQLLTSKSRDYGLRALCAARAAACDIAGMNFEDYRGAIAAVDQRDRVELYSYSLGTLAWIRANSNDFNALAELPKVELALQRVMELEPGDLAASTSMYLGILNTLRPPALGGKPETGRRWFEHALELSGGQDLGIKVEFARGYARLVYDRELHDRLLNEVLSADVQKPGYTLFNVLAQDQARELLAAADEYF